MCSIVEFQYENSYLTHFQGEDREINNMSKTDVAAAPRCYKWVVGWIGWKSPGGGMYRAPYGANNTSKTDVAPWCYKWVDGLDGWMGISGWGYV